MITVIVLLVFGFLLLIFAIIFRSRHTYGYKQIMKQNQNVPPLFKMRSAQIKYQNLHGELKQQPAILQKLEELHTDFDNKRLSVDDYHNALDDLDGTLKLN